MITAEFLTERDDINHIIPECIQLAKAEGAVLPFQYMHMPLTWWDTFSAPAEVLFSQKRGKNFLGLQSRLEKFFLLIAKDGEHLCGIAPLVQYSIKMPASREELQLITFAGDYVLHPFQDFLVDHAVRQQVIAAMLEHIAGLVKNENSIFWAGYLPEESPNLEVLRNVGDTFKKQNINCKETLSFQRGGVWPWTIGGISTTLNKINALCEKTGEHIDGLTELTAKVSKGTPQSLLFSRTRNQLLQEIQDIFNPLQQREELSDCLKALESSLKNSPMLYPYIELPEEREDYFASLSYSTRRYFKRYMKKYYAAGGSFETIPAAEITDQDIDDYIRLHLLRWGSGSASICGNAADYHRKISKAMAGLGMFQLFFARYQDKRIAVHSCFDIGTRREGYLTGVAPEFNHLRSGRLLYLQTIYDAIDRGFKLYELGAVGFDYKMSFVNKAAVAHNFFMCPTKFEVEFDQIFVGFEFMSSS